MGIVDMTTNSNSMGNPFLRLMFSVPDPAASPTLQDLAHLRLDSTLADLPNYDFRVDGTVTGRVQAAEGTAEIMVSDTGVGIAHTHHELIFEKFFQTGEVALHSSGFTKFKGGGPGLGLAIAKGIVLAHEGEIWVESPGHNETTCPGSDFFIRLPLFKE